jgi:hypothetical protein
MGATFSRVKNWVAEVLTYADLNAEFNNILTNLTPAGMDDASANAGAMQATTDPYPGGTESLPTSLEGELQRIRYVIAQITGKTYWYQDPDAAVTFASAAEILAGTEADKAIAPDQLLAAGLVGNRINKTQADSPYTVVAANCSGLTIFTNTGASGETQFNLPAGANGYVVRAVVTAAQYLKLDANGTETIRYLATQSAAGGYVRSNVVGNTIELVWSGTEWVITGIGGAWTYDS